MAFTAAQQALLNAAKKSADDALATLDIAKNSLSVYTTRRNEWRTKYYACKAARDAKSGGIAKNNACHIKTLSNYSLEWEKADGQINSQTAVVKTWQTTYNNALINLDTVIKQIEAEVGADPVFQLQKSKLEQEHLRKLEEQKAAQARKVIIYIVAGVVLIVIVFAALKLFKVI